MRLTAEMTLKRGDYNCFRNSFCGMEFFPEHKHCFFEFFLVISGVLLHRLNGVDYRLNPGNIQLLQPGMLMPCGAPIPEVRWKFTMSMWHLMNF